MSRGAGRGNVTIDNDLVVSGSVSVSNLPVTQSVSGNITVSNLPTTQAVTVGNFPVTQITTVGNFPVTQVVSGKINVLGNLIPVDFDSITLSYTGVDLTGVVYKLVSAPVATLTLAYASNILQSVART